MNGAMQMEDRVCFLCGRNGYSDPLDKHHIFGAANRNKSEEYGLYVYLCHNECHENGKYAVHNNKDTMQKIHEYGQKKVMEKQGWDTERFIKEFGKNYL
jgi:hypothetical protein